MRSLFLVVFLGLNLRLNTFAETHEIFSYVVTNGVVTIIDYSTSSGSLEFPSAINGLPVTRIDLSSTEGPREPINQNVTNVVIPSSVTALGNFSFRWLTNLSALHIPESVTSIDELAWVGLRGLVQFDVDAANPNFSSHDGVLYNKTKQKLLKYPANKSGLSFLIPDEVSEIGTGAFAGSGLQTIVIPSSVIGIGDSAFSGCENLTGLNIPASVKTIGFSKGGFNGNYLPSLVSVNVDEGNMDFSSLDGVVFNKDKSVLIFYPMKKGGSSYTIPNGVNQIGECAFAYARGLNSISIPSGVTSIAREAFAASGLTNISIPNSVTNIESDAFGGCWWLKTVNLPPNLTAIKTNTFSGCAMQSINIPLNVKNIEFGAFQSCGDLTTIDLPIGLQSIGEWAFAGCRKLSVVNVPPNVDFIGEGAFSDCTSLEAINVEAANLHYASTGGVLFNKTQTTLMAYPAGRGEACYNLPNGVVEIGSGAFSGCLGITVLKIPASVATVGNFAFGCSNLKAVIFSGSPPAFTGEAFSSAGSTSPNNSPATVYHMPGASGWGAVYSGRPVAAWALQVPAISNYTSGRNSVSFDYSTTPGLQYRVETSPNLKNWATLTNGWGDGQTKRYDNLSQSADRAFFRLAQENP